MADPAAPIRPRRCPICGKPATQHDRPFCSPRCAEVDLGRWFGEAYRIPGAPPGPPKDDDDNDMTG